MSSSGLLDGVFFLSGVPAESDRPNGLAGVDLTGENW